VSELELEKLKRKQIKRLKQIRQEQGLSIAQIMELMERQGKYVSEATLKKIFADGSEERTFRYQDSIAPVADVLLDIYGDTSGLDDVESLKQFIREKNKLIEFLVIKVEELGEEAKAREKLCDDRKAAYEKTIASLELQIHRLHDQVDRKDQLIERLLKEVFDDKV
jgi:transcriptional regulator with XRE-family HTH domain